MDPQAWRKIRGRVADLLANPRLQELDPKTLQEIVAKDTKKRYDLLYDAQDDATDSAAPETGVWWIRANQGHSIKSVQLELQPVLSAADGGQRNYITSLELHLDTGSIQDVSESHSLSSGYRGRQCHQRNAEILPNPDIHRCRETISAGIKFFLSDNGIVLTGGDERGLAPRFFSRVEDAKRVALPGWEGKPSVQS